MTTLFDDDAAIDDDDSPNPVRRAKNGRPYIIPPEGGKEVTYTRTSNFAKAIDDGASITQWKLQRLTEGFARQPSLLNALLDLVQRGEEIPRTLLDWVIDSGLEVGGANYASRWGTLLHGVAESVDTTDFQPQNLPYDIADALLAYERLIGEAGIIPLAREGFVVNDEFQTAGSYDGLYLLPCGRVVIGDIKTAPLIHQPVRLTAPMIQIDQYANSTHYNPRTGERDLGLLEHVDKTVGLIIQISRDRSRDQLIWVDLTRGHELSELARTVRASRSNKRLKNLPPAAAFSS